MARGHHPLLRHAAAVARRLPMKGSHETTHKQTLQFRMQSQADTQLQQQLQGILRHTCHIHWHTCLNSFGSHAALVAAISNLRFVTHFEFVTVDVDQNMVTKRPYKLVSWVEFECVLHHFSSPTRWNGSRGQVRPETCQKQRFIKPCPTWGGVCSKLPIECHSTWT